MPHAPLRALLLAAGRGERMRPLSDTCPKPLLRVRGRPLIEWHLLALAHAGVRDVVINTAWLEEQFPATLGDGARHGLRIHWQFEQRDFGQALETAGGIATALPVLAPNGDEPFWLVSSDIFAPGFEFDADAAARFAEGDELARLWLVPNPPFHPRGDFDLEAGTGRLRHRAEGPHRYTYANIALARPGLVQGLPAGVRAPLGAFLFAAADQGRLGGCVLTGEWHNVGSPDQLAALERRDR